LTACQADAREGRYAAALAGFVQSLAPQYEMLRRELRARVAELRDNAARQGQHRRTPVIVADLALGIRLFLNYARDAGAIDAAEAEALWERAWTALTEPGTAQAEHQQASESAALFLELVTAAFVSGRVHVANAIGRAPAAPEWMRTFRVHTIPISVVAHVEEVPNDERLHVNEIVSLAADPAASPLLIINHPINVRGLPRADPTPAPDLGQHTDEILAELGYADGEIARVRREGIM